MAGRIALTGATGKIGGAVLDAILKYELAPPADLVIASSSKPDHPKLAHAVSLGIMIRHSNYDSIESMVEAFSGCQRLFLVSSSHIDLDFHNNAKGSRHKHHRNALEAAKRAGISHVYYTSLAFGVPSKAGVMQSHIMTEEFLTSQKDFDFTILREGLYNESWPLYLGHYEIGDEKREKIVIGPDGPISWTSVPDLGLASALILTDERNEWAGKTLYLSKKETLSMSEVAAIVERVRGKTLSLDVRSPHEYIKHYVEEKKMDDGLIKWWSSTYPAMQDGECNIMDSPLEALLASKGRKPISMDQTVKEMLEDRT